MTKNFKALLQNISTKPLAEQKTILNNTIESWKDNKEQNDDILVIGFSVNNENEKSNDTET